MLALATVLTLAAPPPTAESPSRRAPVADGLHAYFEGWRALERFSGVVLYADPEGVRLHRAYLVPNLGTHERDHAFVIASVRKLFTRAVIDALVRSEKLRLDDPIARWFPKVPEAERMTVRHLLEHRSGLPRGERVDYGTRRYDLAEVVDLIETQKLLFPPGEDERYSNFGYWLLDAVIRAVDGPRALETRVLTPAGMKHTFEARERPSSARVARSWVEVDDGLEVVDDATLEQFETGTLFSTAADLLRFARWRGGSMAHAGAKSGYRSYLWSDGRRVLVVLANVGALPAMRVVEDVKVLLDGGTVDPPKPVERVAVEVPVEKLRPYCGRYRLKANGQVLEVRLGAEGQLRIGELRDGELVDPEPLFAESERVFFLRPDRSDGVEFGRDADGETTMTVVAMGGMRLETERL